VVARSILAFFLATVADQGAAETQRFTIAERNDAALATFELPPGWEFEGAAQPPSKEGPSYLGRLTNATVANQARSWRVAYTQTAHVPAPADTIDAASVLGDIRRGIALKQQSERGSPVEEVEGWLVSPRYEERFDALLWALNIRFRGQTESTCNYAIRVLMRQGYLSFDGVGPASRAPQLREDASEILSGLEVAPSRRHEDFDAHREALAPFSALALLRARTEPSSGIDHSGPGARATAAALLASVALIWALFAAFRGRTKARTDPRPASQTPPRRERRGRSAARRAARSERKRRS